MWGLRVTSEVRRVFTSLYFYPVNKSQTQKPKQHTLSNELAMSQPRTKPKLSSVFLPDHIIDEILSWVPAKSLIRFRCVSKSRYSIITNPFSFPHSSTEPNCYFPMKKTATIIMVICYIHHYMWILFLIAEICVLLFAIAMAHWATTFLGSKYPLVILG